MRNIETEYRSFYFNISKDIIIKLTDKGRGLVLMDKAYYRGHLVNKEHLHSNLYKEVSLDSDKRSLQTVSFISRKI